MSTPAQATSSTAGESDPVVQYIVLRRDLWAEQGWPLGPLIAQACHASLAAMWLSKNDPDAQQYVSDDHIDSMHKVCASFLYMRHLEGQDVSQQFCKTQTRRPPCQHVVNFQFTQWLIHGAGSS